MTDMTLPQEIEFQKRKVAALDRYLSQIDLDEKVLREVVLALRKSQGEYAKRLDQEREYLEWLVNEAGQPPAEEAEETAGA